MQNGILGYVGKVGDEYNPFFFEQPTFDPRDVEISNDMFLITKEEAQANQRTQAAKAATVPTEIKGQAEVKENDGPYIAQVTPLGAGRVTLPEPAVPQTPPPPPASTAGKLTWVGLIPAQKWTNFYMKILTKFAASQELKLTLKVEVTVEATGGDQLSTQKIEETKIALRELGLEDEVRIT